MVPDAAVDPDVVLGLVECTGFAGSTDETRYNLNGVYFEPVTGALWPVPLRYLQRLSSLRDAFARLGRLSRGCGPACRECSYFISMYKTASSMSVCRTNNVQRIPSMFGSVLMAQASG